MVIVTGARKMEKLLEIISEDSELLVVNKPAGLVCHPTKAGPYSSLISRARLHLGAAAEPQLINRLDRETSGVTFIAKTPESARELRRVWERREVEKLYLAITNGALAEAEGLIEAPLGKDDSSRVAIKDCVRADGLPAVTRFRRLKTFCRSCNGVERDFSLLEVSPETGRKHQIRIHLASIGHPIVGDKIYGGDEDLYLALVEDRLTAEQRQRLILPHHALHAARVSLEWRERDLNFTAEPEAWFTDFAS